MRYLHRILGCQYSVISDKYSIDLYCFIYDFHNF